MAGEILLQEDDFPSSSEHSESESLSGVLTLCPELLCNNLENDSLIILGIKLEDGDTFDENIP